MVAQTVGNVELRANGSVEDNASQSARLHRTDAGWIEREDDLGESALDGVQGQEGIVDGLAEAEGGRASAGEGSADADRSDITCTSDCALDAEVEVDVYVGDARRGAGADLRSMIGVDAGSDIDALAYGIDADGATGGCTEREDDAVRKGPACRRGEADLSAGFRGGCGANRLLREGNDLSDNREDCALLRAEQSLERTEVVEVLKDVN